MKPYILALLAIILVAGCKRQDFLDYSYCFTASDHPNIREAFTVNGVDSVFTKNVSESSYGNLTDTFIHFQYNYVDEFCDQRFTMRFLNINKYLSSKQTIYKPYLCDRHIPGACKSVGFFSFKDLNEGYNVFEIFEGDDPGNNWVEISSLTNERIKGSYHATFLRNNHDINNNSSFMDADTLRISGNFDIPNPQ